MFTTSTVQLHAPTLLDLTAAHAPILIPEMGKLASGESTEFPLDTSIIYLLVRLLACVLCRAKITQYASLTIGCLNSGGRVKGATYILFT